MEPKALESLFDTYNKAELSRSLQPEPCLLNGHFPFLGCFSDRHGDAKPCNDGFHSFSVAILDTLTLLNCGGQEDCKGNGKVTRGGMHPWTEKGHIMISETEVLEGGNLLQ